MRLFENKTVRFSPDGDSVGGGFDYSSLATDDPGESAAGGDYGEPQPGSPQSQAQPAPAAASDPWDNDDVWANKVRNHARFQTDQKAIQSYQDQVWAKTMQDLGLWDEVQKRYKALQEKNPYWTQRQVQQATQQQTQAAHKADPALSVLEKRLAAAESMIQREQQAKARSERQSIETGIKSEVKAAIGASGVGNAEDAAYVEFMTQQTLAAAMRDVNAGKRAPESAKEWEPYVKQAHESVSRFFGGSQPKMPSQTVIPPTGVAPGLSQKQQFDAYKKSLESQLVTPD